MLTAEVMLGLATLHLSMRELYLKIAEIPRNAIDELPEFYVRRCLQCIGFSLTVCKWPVFMLGAIGLTLLCLEMIALDVM
jgi:hypothetical protein